MSCLFFFSKPLLKDATTSHSSSVCKARKVQYQVSKDKCREVQSVLSHTYHFSQWTWTGNVPEEIFLLRLTTPAGAANDPMCTTLLITLYSALGQKYKNIQPHFTISVPMTEVNRSNLNSLFLQEREDCKIG